MELRPMRSIALSELEGQQNVQVVTSTHRVLLVSGSPEMLHVLHVLHVLLQEH